MMKNNFSLTKFDLSRIFLLFLVMVFLLLTGNVIAKSENSNSGQVKSENVVVGNVDNVNNDKITVEDKKDKGKKVERLIDNQVQIIKQDNKGPSGNQGKGNAQNLIKKQDKVAIISTDSAEASQPGKVKKVVKIFVKEASEAAQSKRKALQGVITEISGSTLTIAHQIHRERINQVDTNASTVIKMKGITNATFSDLKVGQRVVAVGDLVGTGILAKRVHVIPGKATGIFKKNPVASSSATPTASASASPVVSPTPTASASATPTPTP